MLWESLNEEDKGAWLKVTVLQNETDSVVQGQSEKKDKVERTFREYCRCIFTGRCKELRAATKAEKQHQGENL